MLSEQVRLCDAQEKIRTATNEAIVMKYRFILVAVFVIQFASFAQAKTIEKSLSMLDLERAGLAQPSSATFLYLGADANFGLQEQCLTAGQIITVKRSRYHEQLSHSIRISFSNEKPILRECLRGHSCYEIEGTDNKETLPRGMKSYSYSGRASEYKIRTLPNITAAGHELSCSSMALDVLSRKGGTLKTPTSLWLLNYGNKLIFFNDTSKATWFSVNLPKGVKFGRENSFVVDAFGRFLISDKKNVLLMDTRLNAALVYSQGQIFKTIWGLSSAAHQDEWQSARGPEFISSRSGTEPIFLLNGVIEKGFFWSWEDVIKTTSGLPAQPQAFPGTHLTSNEIVLPHARITTFAVMQDNSELVSLLKYDSRKARIETIKDNIKIDSRARSFDFVIIDEKLNRFTADGIYRTDGGVEKATILKGFKGYFRNISHQLISREYKGKNCELKVWSSKANPSGAFYALLTDIKCTQREGFGTSPWGYSVTWLKGNTITSKVSVTDEL